MVNLIFSSQIFKRLFKTTLSRGVLDITKQRTKEKRISIIYQKNKQTKGLKINQLKNNKVRLLKDFSELTEMLKSYCAV